MARYCPTKGKHILNPVIDWTDEEVWEFIKGYNIPYCKLYDEGWKRIGCIGCPMSTKQEFELERQPKYKQAYMSAFQRMLDNYTEEVKWKTPQDVYEWWVSK